VLAAGPGAGTGQGAELLLFGDADHRTYLGCLTCGSFNAESVCNRYGNFGSPLNAKSMWNPVGDYGSRFSPQSPWNNLATDPPVIVDRQGGFYGYFTAVRFYPQRTTIRFFVVLLDDSDEVNRDLQAARDRFCGN
jgi:hypothetical protein